MRLDGCRALITGASSGIGREIAQRLGARALTLVLIARRRERLEEVRAEIAAKNPGVRIEIRRVDLSKENETNELIAWLETENLAIDFLVNNAGLGDLGAFATADPRRVDQMTLVNMVALTRLTRALLPAMIAQRRGAILNVSSSAGFLPMPGFAVYAATKAYVTSFSDGLRGELRSSGVTVTALCPGPVRTEFTQVSRREKQSDAKFGPSLVYVSVEKVAADALRAVECDRALIIPGVWMKLGMAMARLTPLFLLRFASRFRSHDA